MKRLFPLLLLAAALMLAACGGKTLDTANVEKDIQEIASQDGVETTVECPDEVDDVEEGTTYECDITYAGNNNNKQTVEMKVAANDESEFVDQKAVQDEGLIRQLIAQTDEDPTAICDHLEEGFQEQLLEQAGTDDCAAAAQEGDDGKPAVIKSVEVKGDTATVVSDQSTSTLERGEDGSWLITAIE
jgi:outer membrane lipopolysaccharide assembly protein LptE/RlpB